MARDPSARKRGPIDWSPITAARELAGLSVQQLADKLGVTREAVYRMERREEDAKLSSIREAVEACGLELVVSFSQK